MLKKSSGIIRESDLDLEHKEVEEEEEEDEEEEEEENQKGDTTSTRSPLFSESINTSLLMESVYLSQLFIELALVNTDLVIKRFKHQVIGCLEIFSTHNSFISSLSKHQLFIDLETFSAYDSSL